MAMLNCHIHSDVLKRATGLTIEVPEKNDGHCQVLYLLHGLTGNQDSYMLGNAIHRLVADYNLVVVTPDVKRSFYANMVKGDRYWDYVSQELPQIVANLCPISHERKDTFAGGISMGGYGALKLALSMPEKFSKVMALSPVTGLRTHFYDGGGLLSLKDFQCCFGSKEELRKSDANLENLVKKIADVKERPQLLMRIGREDYLYQDCCEFRKQLDSVNYSYDYQDEPGLHEWRLWQKWMPDALKFLVNG